MASEEAVGPEPAHLTSTGVTGGGEAPAALLVPNTVVWADATQDVAGPESLYPEELESITKAVDKRRREFTTVRVCARRAMATLGLAPVPVLRSKRGEPRWPDGVVGSMTHCDGYRAAALARAGDVRSIGIDAEPNDVLPDGVLSAVALPTEETWARRAAGRDRGGVRVHGDRLLFSAKESVFKTWYPLTGLELGFDEAEITFAESEAHAGSGTFAARLSPATGVPAGVPSTFDGRWTAHRGLVITAIVLPRE